MGERGHGERLIQPSHQTQFWRHVQSGKHLWSSQGVGRDAIRQAITDALRANAPTLTKLTPRTPYYGSQCVLVNPDPPMDSADPLVVA